MRLYPSIPHDVGLKALKKALDKRGQKIIPTEDLLNMAEFFLKVTFSSLMLTWNSYRYEVCSYIYVYIYELIGMGFSTNTRSSTTFMPQIYRRYFLYSDSW